MKNLHLLSLEGDGVGPEVVDAGLKVLDYICRLEGINLTVDDDLIGGAAWDVHGTFCRNETVEAARSADAVLVGAVGGPKWDELQISGKPADKDGLVRLRQELDTYACLRPARAWEPLIDRTPFKPEVVKGVDMMILRELCGGIYFGEPRGIDVNEDGTLQAYDANFYTSGEIERIARTGFELARRRGGKLHSIDKANVMESGVLWRRVVTELGERDYPDIVLRHYFADHAVYQLVRTPLEFDVILADNLFGDIISDLAGTLAGSLGMLPSVSVCGLAGEGEANRPAIYEPVHGSAPDIAGEGIANPIGTILSAAMLFQYSLSRKDLTARLVQAVERALAGGTLTRDLGGSAGTQAMATAIINAFE